MLMKKPFKKGMGFNPAPYYAVAGYTAQGVNFDGTNDYMTVAALTSIADGPTGIVSFWFKINGGDNNFQILFESRDQTSVELYRDNANKWQLSLANPGLTGVFGWGSTNTYSTLSNPGWHHLISSWDVSAGTGSVYIDDAVAATPSITGGNTINYATAAGNFDFANRATGSLLINMDIADFYFNTVTSLDLSVTTNRRKFISASVHPVDLGASGSLPTGTAPMVYLSGATAAWNTNKGTGGGFTLTGALTNSATNP